MFGGNGKEDNDEYEKCTSTDCRNKEACVTIYQYSNYKGENQCHTFLKDECVTLNDWWIDEGSSRVSSVGTHNTCIRVYMDRGCNGDSIEIKPGSSHHSSLGRFDENVKSISACKRPVSQPCSVRDLFSTKIEAENVYDATTEILGIFDQLASLAASGFSSFIPGLDLFYDGLKLVTGMFDSDKATEALIDAKIEAAFAKNSASQISAKVHTINNRLLTVFSNFTPAADRRIELGVALNTCEEVAKLFEDENYSFSQNKLVSSPCSIFFGVLICS